MSSAVEERLVIVGAGLCGSILAMRLRNIFDVTVVEQSEQHRPLYDDIECPDGGVTTTINRAAGLGGTTNYWHNALIELDDDDLVACGLDPDSFSRYYARAWTLFMPDDEITSTEALGRQHAAAVPGQVPIAHMVVRHTRMNLWERANEAFPGAPVRVVYGHAERITPASPSVPGTVEVRTSQGVEQIPADRIIVCAGGLATPVLLAASAGITDRVFGGYHDHPMAYVAKVRLRSDSVLKQISCVETGSNSVRAGFVFKVDGLKAVFYLRPALSLNLKSITGEARYILSDLRNDPFSPKKIWQLLCNIEALREAILFKTKAGFLGDYYSVLMLGEQAPRADRGVRMRPGRRPLLNWMIDPSEHGAYVGAFKEFETAFASEIVGSNVVPYHQWDYRTAAHHSGTSSDFLDPAARGLAYFAANDLPGVFVCDGSLLRAGGVANSGLTLVALCHLLADQLSTGATP